MVRWAFAGCLAIGAAAFALGLSSPPVSGGTALKTNPPSLVSLLDGMSKNDRIRFENYIKDIVSANCRVVSGQKGGLGTGSTSAGGPGTKDRINCFDLHTQD